MDACVIWATSDEVGQALRSQHHCGYDRFVLTYSEIEMTKGNNKNNNLKDGDYAFSHKKCEDGHEVPFPELDNVLYSKIT